MSKDINVPITVECECGKDLSICHIAYSAFDTTIVVEPCPDCTKENYEEGNIVGRDDGYEEGHDEGYDDGREVGYEQGCVEGYDEGHTIGTREERLRGELRGDA